MFDWDAWQQRMADGAAAGLARYESVRRYQERQAENWAYGCVQGMPERWAKRLIGRWRKERAEAGEYAPANRALRTLVERLSAIRLPLDASDDDVCRVADECARYAASFADILHTPEGLRAQLAHYANSLGIEPPLNDPDKRAHVQDVPAIARMADPVWWRRKLRALHAKVVEGAAVSLGYVNRTSDCYVSNESLARRQQQNRRNEKMLENTIAVNETGDEYTLAELSAKGIANKAIRRAELMTRIAGFERIAKDCGDVGLFITLTCPSRMHKWRTVKGGRVVQNTKYDGTLPNQAQKYLAGDVWAKTRAAWKREEIVGYGFRIVEPNHDGTPHWHMLLFFAPDKAERAVEILRKYALKDSGDEAGAKDHRVKVVKIDWERGSAAGYIAKYVAKNIDGYKVDKDLLGNDAIETSARVEAWAATWRIRQFQQIGGAPVGVWRELRRVKELPELASPEMIRAWNAVNRVETEEGEIRPADWAEYVLAQGGVAVGRNAALTIDKKDVEEVGRYYETKQPVPVGVAGMSFELMPRLDDEILTDEQVDEMMEEGVVAPIVYEKFSLKVVAKSVRHVWEIVSKNMRAAVDVVRRVTAEARARTDKFMELRELREALRQGGDWVSEVLVQMQINRLLGMS